MAYTKSLYVKNGKLRKYNGAAEELFIQGGKIKNIGRNAFSKCKTLKKITISDIGYIDEYAFSSCPLLESVELINVKSIRGFAFKSCRQLKTVILGEGSEEIQYCAFHSCVSLENINIPKSVTYIGHSVFAGCKALKNISVAEDNRHFVFMGNCLINTDRKLIVAGFDYPEIPEGSADTIGFHAFVNRKLPKIFAIPEGINTIQSLSFWGCEGVEEIKLPESLLFIGSYTFSICETLKTVNIPKNVREIDESAFECCDSLTSIYIPKSVRTIHARVFYACKNLKDVYCEADSKPDSWDEKWLEGCTATIHFGA